MSSIWKLEISSHNVEFESKICVNTPDASLFLTLAVCVFFCESTTRNKSKPSEVPISHRALLFLQSLFQLVRTSDIIGRVQVIYLLVFCRYCDIIITG